MLLVLGIVSLAWNVAAVLLYPLLASSAGRRIGRAAIAHGYRLYWWFAGVTGMMRLDAAVLDGLRHEQGLIVVANHPSALDALMLVARLPNAYCVMKASLMGNPFLGAGARLARYIRNDSAHGMVRLAVEELRQGGQLLLFPEGTRTVQPPLNAFRPGFTLIAKRAGAPIQTVFIETESPYLGKGWPLWRLPPLPIVFTVRLGRRFEPAADHAALLAEIEVHFKAELSQPSPVFSAPAQRSGT